MTEEIECQDEDCKCPCHKEKKSGNWSANVINKSESDDTVVIRCM